MRGARGLVGVSLTEVLSYHLSEGGKGPPGGGMGTGIRDQSSILSWMNPLAGLSVSGQLSLSYLICEMALMRAGGTRHLDTTTEL